MSSSHELIHPNYNLPIKMFCFSTDNANRIIPKHWHQSSELIYCLTGEIKITFNQTSYLLKKNDCIMINPNVVHSTQSQFKSNILVIQFPLDFMKEISNNTFNSNWIFNLNTTNENNIVFETTIVPILNKLIHSINLSSMKNHLEQLYLINKLISNFYGPFSKTIDQHYVFLHEKALMPLSEIVIYISENYTNIITLETLSKQFNYSESYLSRYFKLNMGIGLSSYITSIRLDKAYGLMKHTSNSLTTIAFEVGFSSYRNFYNSFKHYYGINPKEFKIKNEL